MPLLRFLYCHNPFYLASAALVFFGSQTLFDNSTEASSEAWNAWSLFGFVATYTMLLVAAGVAIIRWGRIWEDARSIFMVVLVLWVALSSSFDELLVDDLGSGTLLLGIGLLLAIGSSEFVLRATGLPLGRGYRLPFFGLLALFFVYPLIPIHLGPRSMAADVAAAAFGPLVALGYLAFVPAIERGTHAVRQNAPWRFPFYPWIPLLVLLPCGVVRGRSLCLAFGSGSGDDTIFAPYLIAPAVLVIGVLLEVGGRRHGRALVRHLALAMPLIAIALCVLPDPSATQRDFLDRWAGAGTPTQWALLAAILFYAVATKRRSPAADLLLASSIVLWGSLVTDGSKLADGFTTWSQPTSLSLLIAAGVLAMRWRSSVGHRIAVGFLGLAAIGSVNESTSQSVLLTLYLASQGALGWMWVVSWTCAKREAEVLRSIIAAAAPPSIFAALSLLGASTVDPLTRVAAALSSTSLLALQVAWTYRYPTALHTTMLIASVTVLVGRATLELRTLSVAALRVVGGLALFAIGVAVSIAKIRARTTTVDRGPLEIPGETENS